MCDSYLAAVLVLHHGIHFPKQNATGCLFLNCSARKTRRLEGLAVLVPLDPRYTQVGFNLFSVQVLCEKSKSLFLYKIMKCNCLNSWKTMPPRFVVHLLMTTKKATKATSVRRWMSFLHHYPWALQ